MNAQPHFDPLPVGPERQPGADAIRRMSRRDALKTSLTAAGAAALVPGAVAAEAPTPPDARRASTRRYDMKKSINLWAFPYPQRMTLAECLQLAKEAGFDGIELNYDRHQRALFLFILALSPDQQ